MNHLIELDRAEHEYLLMPRECAAIPEQFDDPLTLDKFVRFLSAYFARAN